MESHRFIFERGRTPERLDRFLASRLPEVTRSQIKNLIEEGLVLLDGDPAKAGTRLKGGEVLSVKIPPPIAAEAAPQDIPLVVLYEDSHLIVIDKPAGLVVHPAPGHQEGTLVNALLHHCRDLSGIGGELRPGIVHRLDKDTSGVLVATKNDAAHAGLAAQFKDHTITRRYVALIHGFIQNDEGTVNRPVGRHPTHRKKMSSRSRAGRRAVTRWKVLKRYDLDRLTLVELTLETGRTHQIRVHFAEMNLPLVGDAVYGDVSRVRSLHDLELRRRIQRLDRQALHAVALGFIHPVSGEYMEFRSPVPSELSEVLHYLDAKYASAETAAIEAQQK